MAIKQSERVREIVRLEYVLQARQEGRQRLSVKAGDVLRRAEASSDFPRARTPLICNVLQSKKLLEDNGLEIEKIEGPPSLQSRTVVVHYRLLPQTKDEHLSSLAEVGVQETPEARSLRLTARLRGLMKDEIAAHGGAEGYLRWVRGEDEAGGK